MKNRCRLAIALLLGGSASSWMEAQVVPTVTITAPTTVSTGATYAVSVAAADTSGHLLNLNVTRNGVYWNSASSIPNDPTRYNLGVSGNDTAPTTPGTITFYAAVTSDASSNNATANVTVVDGTPPSVPTGLSATSITTTGFTLNWTAATDNVAVTGYEVQQDSTSLGTVTVLNKAVSGLTPGLTYAMTVRAKDAALNWSAWSTALNVTTLKANQAAVTITSPTTGTYGTAYTATASGGNGSGALVWALASGSTAANAAIDSSTGVITADSNGTVVINVYRAADINYNQSATTANFTVTFAKRAITVTLAGSKVYDGTTASTGASASITTGSLGGTDTIGYAFAATSSANAGTYSGLTTATISNTNAPTARSASYTITYAGSFTVTKADQPAVTITSAAGGTYGTAYTATATGGLGTGALVWALGSGSTAPGAAINSGTGAITVTGSGTVVINVYRAASTNYNVSATTANFTVTFAARPITVTLTGSKTYDGTTASAGASASRTAGTLAGTDTIAFAYAATPSANAGTYPGLATTTISNTVAPLDRTSSYAITNAGVYTINKANQAAVTITSPATGTYGTPYTATATGGNGTGALVWALGTGSTASGAAIDAVTGAITANSSGTVVINVKRAADTNYNVSATTANFTVTFAKVAITVTLTGTKAYNGTTASTGASASITSGALVAGDTIGYAFAACSSANAGTYTGLTTATISNTVAPTTRTTSYTITYAGSYIITKINQAAVTISSSASGTYGTAYTATATGGTGTGALVWTLATGSTASGAAINSSTGAVTATSNGTVVFNVYRAADTNYNQSGTTANFTVTFAKRAITVTLSGSKAYDGTTTSTGAAANITTGTLGTGDTIGYAFANTSSAAPGTYNSLTTATVSNATAPTNRSGSYTITYAGTYTITKANQAPVTITSASTGTYGTAYTATASGGSGTGALTWALGTGSTVSGAAIVSTTGVTTANSSGTLVIKATKAADTNYNAYTTADFPITVAQRPITVTLSGSKTYDGTTASTGASAALTAGTLAAGDTIGYAYAATSSANAGSYSGLATATVSNVSAPTTRTGSYAITYAGSYTINAAGTTFSLSSTAFYYNGAAQGPTVIPNPAGATFSTGGTLSATSIGSYIGTATATGNYSGTNNNLTWSIAADTTAPTVPTGLAASNVTTTSFTLTWTASTDNVGVALYTIYQDGVSIGTSATPTFNVTGLNASTTYSMTVTAQDAVPNVSAASTPLAVTTQTDTGGVPVTGMRLWLRADMGTTVDGSNGVSTWTDQSGSHNDATQGNPLARPVLVAGGMNNQPVLRFNGTTNNLALPNLMNGLTQGEIFIVTKLKDFTNAANPLGHFGGGLGTIYGSSQMWNDFGTNDNVPFASPGNALLTPHVFSASMTSAGSMIVEFNNVSYLTRSEGWMGFRSNPILGSDWQNEYYNGDISEVIIYDHVLSVADHSAVSSYLSAKYGVGAPTAPVITSAPTRTAALSTPLSPNYVITGTYSPTSFAASPLPAGLSLNTSTGVISGTPLETGTTDVTISATNAIGTGSAQLTFTVFDPTAPVITSPLTKTGVVNAPLNPTYTITATNSPTSFNALGLPAGLSINTSTGVISGTPTETGLSYVSISATNATTSGTAILALTISPDSSVVPTAALRLWLRADMGVTVDGANGVSTWLDQSTAHKDATQAVASTRPQLIATGANGQPVLRFDGVDDWMDVPIFMTGATQGEIFVVAKLPSFATRNDGMWTLGGSDGTDTEIIGTRHLTDDFGRTPRWDAGAPVVPLTDYVIYNTSAMTGDWTVRLNGQTQIHLTSNTFSIGPNNSLGRNQAGYLQGDIAEVIAYSQVLNASDRAIVSGYLASKYGVGKPVITSAATLSGGINAPLSPTYAITASGAPTSFGATGLPAGLTVNTATGVISGTPTALGNSTATISATNPLGTGSAQLLITITPPIPVISSPLSKTGTVNVPLNPTYTIVANNSPTSYDAVGLPAGLSVNTSTGVISGTPTSLGTSNVTIKATNANGTGSAILVMTIVPPIPVITSALNWSGTINSPLSPTYIITGSNSPTAFGAAGLPAGLSLNTATGEISGTPSAVAVTDVTITATNAGGTGSATLHFTVNPIAATFDLNAASFIYNGAPQGPTIVVTPAGASYSTGGTLSASAIGSYTATATANGIFSGANNNLTWSIVPETVPPSAPAGLVMSNPASTSFTLTWTPSTDNVAVTNYTVYRDGIAIGTSATPTFNVTGLTPFTSYVMTVTAQDLSGNVSAVSTGLTVVTLVDSSQVPTLGMRMWLRTDVGITVDGSGGVQNWVDYSGRGINATQATASNRPQLIANATQGQPVVRFDGVDDYLSVPFAMASTQQGELFVVVKVPNFATRDDGLWALGGATGASTELNGATRVLTEDFARDTRSQVGAPIIPVSNYVIYDVSGVLNDWTVRLNGLTQFHASANNVSFGTTCTLGKGTGKYLQGDIAEVIAYDHPVTAAERDQVAGYLTLKFAPAGLMVPPQPTLNTAFFSTSATLTWNALSGHTTIIIERYSAGSGWVQIAQVTDVTTYTDSGLPVGQAYSYRIKFRNYSGDSVYSGANSNDTDGDGVPDAIELLMGRNPNAGVILDSGNQLQLVIITPTDLP